MKITVYVGDVTEELATQVLKLNKNATLITYDNYRNLAPGNYYVSVGDLKSLDQLKSVLRQATDIIYMPPGRWSHTDMQSATEQCFDELHGLITVQNFSSNISKNLDLFLGLADNRKTKLPQLWSIGCSVTFGLGVDQSERYGQLLADSTGLEVSFLAKNSSSIIWQADQILRSDIRSGDLVVWGLTALPRFPYVINQQLIHANISPRVIDKIKHLVSVDMFDTEDLLYRTIVSIYQVINFCRKIGAKLILANLLSKELPMYIQTYKEFVNEYTIKFVDLGTDDLHPGPKQHILYCEQLLNKINELYPEVLLKS